MCVLFTLKSRSWRGLKAFSFCFVYIYIYILPFLFIVKPDPLSFVG